jgi:hypothetical protein
MAYYKEKHASEVYSSAVSPSDPPYLTNSRKSGFSIPDMEKKDLVCHALSANPTAALDAWIQPQTKFLKRKLTRTPQKIKKRIRVLRAISRAIAVIASGYMLGTLAYAVSKFFLTKNHVVSGTPYWPMPTKLWPTYMLLAIAATTVSMNLITLSTYVCGIGAANKTSSVFGIIGIIFSASEIVAWGISAGLFRMARTGNDLWGYSCLDSTDALAAEIQAQRKSFVNFGQLCNMQVSLPQSPPFNAVM